MKSREELQREFAGAPPELPEYASRLQQEVAQARAQLTQQEQALVEQQQELIKRQQELIEQRQELIEQRQELIQRQEELFEQQQLLAEARTHIAELKRQLFGPKADKLNPEQEEQLRQVVGDLQEHNQRPPPVSRDVLEPIGPRRTKKNSNGNSASAGIPSQQCNWKSSASSWNPTTKCAARVRNPDVKSGRK